METTISTVEHRDMPVGTWVASFHALSPDFGAQIGRVVEVHSDGILDIVLYAKTGKRIGRESPAMGGPKGYEPCCSADGWEPIEKPDFDFIGGQGFYARHLTRLRQVHVPDGADENYRSGETQSDRM